MPLAPELSRAALDLPDRFRTPTLVGCGGCAQVYRAEDLWTGREVALKVLRKDLLSNDLAREGLRREAKALQRLRHPGVVGLVASGVREEWPWLATEWVDGLSLTAVMAGSRAKALRALNESARALAQLHRNGIVHRDVKPDNILVAGSAVIIDLGLCRILDEPPPAIDCGEVVGTPAYMAPEQIRGDSDLVSTAMDVYALGVILYEILAGRLPFVEPRMSDLFDRVLADSPIPPRAVDFTIPSNLEWVCLRAMRREPRMRFADGDAFADALGVAQYRISA